MKPIPLRTLTVLLNYERMVSDPRFQGERILESSLASPSDNCDSLKAALIDLRQCRQLGPCCAQLSTPRW